MSVSSIVRKIMMSQFNQAFQYFIDGFPVSAIWPSLFRIVGYTALASGFILQAFLLQD